MKNSYLERRRPSVHYASESHPEPKRKPKRGERDPVLDAIMAGLILLMSVLLASAGLLTYTM